MTNVPGFVGFVPSIRDGKRRGEFVAELQLELSEKIGKVPRVFVKIHNNREKHVGVLFCN